VLGVLRLNTWIQHKQHFCSFSITRTEFIKLWKMLNPKNNADKKALNEKPTFFMVLIDSKMN
jgi:hypothetical protein